MGSDITKARIVHERDGAEHMMAFEYCLAPDYVKFKHTEALGRKEDTIGRRSPDESFKVV